jgi:Restriction endonuclease BglII
VFWLHHDVMKNHPLVPDDISQKYDVSEWRNGLAILAAVRPNEWAEMLEVLRGFTLLRSDIVNPGGAKSDIAKKIDGHFTKLGWQEKQFDTKIVVDKTEYHTPTHKVDCYKNRVALEVEWNNKDPFFDRDLNNFRLLFELRAIDVGVIITRSSELQVIFNALGKGTSYGNSTTHMNKLVPRLEGGGGGGCPVVTFGIRSEAYVNDGPDQ